MNQKLKVAVPTQNNLLTAHFGHCEKFAIIDIEDNIIVNETHVDPPIHQPGVYPQFLAQQGVDLIIAGGMGMKAQNLFAQYNIKVYIGVQNGTPKQLAEDYLKNQLQTGRNLCDH
ncbi:MAG: NifB/NifX family molybdenum-iron cluster-binding protein [Bacteroidales bacterium]|nr:NifB/NifX family molybdenum-iron cluster-binding protein [Bacteroidales bacterium]